MATNLDERAATQPGTPASRRWRWVMPLALIVAYLAVGAPLTSLGGKLSSIQRNDAAVYLPTSSETTRVLEEAKRFTPLESTTAIVVYTAASGRDITPADRVQVVLVALRIVSLMNTTLASPPAGPIVSDDGRAAELVLQFAGTDTGVLRTYVDTLRNGMVEIDGLQAHVAGPAAATTDLLEVYGTIDGMLLLVTGAAVLLILILVYRSPILPFAVLAVAGVALELANGAAYLLGRSGVIAISGQVQGILDVLVLGAGTDYALLLVSRFREELRHHSDRANALRAALRAAAAPMLASGGTVILGLLCLTVSDLPATRGLGPVAALGIFFALLSMLVLLPAILLLLGRAAFWPFRSPAAGAQPAAGRWWPRVAAGVGRRPRLIWLLTAAVLGLLAVGITQLQADGVPRTAGFRTQADSVTAQEILSAHYPAASGSPVVIIARSSELAAVRQAAQRVPGVSEATYYVDPLLDYDHQTKGTPAPAPADVDGRGQVRVTLAAAADSPAAAATLRALRTTVHGVAGADAVVGGYTAGTVDGQDAARTDRLVVIPLVLLVVFGVLALLLRAIVAPVLLIATVILSFAATLGVCGVVFQHVLHYAGAETSFPLFAFVFLVALGVDYNIFLMTRVREETAHLGHRAGTLRGLVVTGGVITSAGLVLAATFASLSVIPLVYLAELAFAVSFGVLLDTFVVRSLLVPALTLDLGRRIWWPGRLRRADP